MFTLPPPHARPLHCGSCWALGHHNRLSVGTDGGSFGSRAQKAAEVGGPWRAGSRGAVLPETWENIRAGGGRTY